MDNNQKITFAGVIYKRAISSLDRNKIWEIIHSTPKEETKLLAIVDLLKLGDFSVKTELIKMMMESSDCKIRLLCCRIFCCIANHSDCSLFRAYLENILERGDEAELKDFVLCSQYTLSPEILPYLLALLSEWEGSEIEEKVRIVLGELFPFINFLSEDVSVNMIEEIFAEKISLIDKEIYFYHGEPSFPGVWTKELLERAIDARWQGDVLRQTFTPSILSLWSGEVCPAFFLTKIDDDMIGNLHTYVKQIAFTKWDKGCKYFYGHKIK